MSFATSRGGGWGSFGAKSGPSTREEHVKGCRCCFPPDQVRVLCYVRVHTLRSKRHLARAVRVSQPRELLFVDIPSFANRCLRTRARLSSR